MIENYIETRDNEVENMTLDFAKQRLRLELEIKNIKDSIKEVNADAKTEGINVKSVNAALTRLKKLAKQKELERKEEDFYVDAFFDDIDITTMVSELTRKD